MTRTLEKKKADWLTSTDPTWMIEHLKNINSSMFYEVLHILLVGLPDQPPDSFKLWFQGLEALRSHRKLYMNQASVDLRNYLLKTDWRFEAYSEFVQVLKTALDLALDLNVENTSVGFLVKDLSRIRQKNMYLQKDREVDNKNIADIVRFLIPEFPLF